MSFILKSCLYAYIILFFSSVLLLYNFFKQDITTVELIQKAKNTSETNGNSLRAFATMLIPAVNILISLCLFFIAASSEFRQMLLDNWPND